MVDNIKSQFLRLSKDDFVRGFIIAILAAIFSVIQQSLTSDTPIDTTEIIKVVEIAVVTYLSKNLLTTSEGKFLGAF